ncbi:hypothetical protein CORC01_07358 [Colletotrichum orchidophilum]|uniref:Uncharacterized protein n=1 Tax=Colletotrichum orchidophilum TaxID=1209926 RepID=A0A1G4B7M7_9PEZI|nr:uncharacterized protein CORC01_07358 [Colletotrichum orchidophilum]OHE97303.1 hypothetical protein CORC01_07358 [Colletotrichum orchidophilum]
MKFSIFTLTVMGPGITPLFVPNKLIQAFLKQADVVCCGVDPCFIGCLAKDVYHT